MASGPLKRQGAGHLLGMGWARRGTTSQLKKIEQKPEKKKKTSLIGVKDLSCLQNGTQTLANNFPWENYVLNDVCYTKLLEQPMH